jgi:anti-sigma regulatory factor (Ser/Thr protein kinase)
VGAIRLGPLCSPLGDSPSLNDAAAPSWPERNRPQWCDGRPEGNIDAVEQSAIRNETMNSTLETTKSTLWPQSPIPRFQGTAWQWQLSTLRQLSSLRADLRTRLRRVGCDDTSRHGDPASDGLLLVVDELASNALRHGAEPVHDRVMTTTDGWLIDISDGAADRGPQPAVGRDPARGGMGLHHVAALTTGHGWAVSAGRKHVWAFLPRGRTDRFLRASRDARGVEQPGPDGDEALRTATCSPLT